MSFLKQLLTPFIEFDEDKKKELAKQNTPITSSSPPVSPPILPADENAQHPLISSNVRTPEQTPTYSPEGVIADPLPEHEQYFEKLIDEANLKNPFFQGTDFKEFMDSKIDIDDITDENLKYRTAFNVLKSTGLTKEKLISTGQEYLNIIGRDLNAFQSAHAEQYKKEVGQKESLIQKKAEELQALTQRINTLKTEINQLTQDINLTKDKLNTTKNSFLLAGEKKQKEIQTELQKIAEFFHNES
jgi:archaellum component FlaC